jgi:hypothetical protein
MANVVFDRLLVGISPRNNNYFELFNNQADCAVKGQNKVLGTI